MKAKIPQLCLTLYMDCIVHRIPGQNTGVSSLFLFRGIFPTQGSNPGLPHCRRILYQLNHNESPRILEWVAYRFSSGELILGSPAMQVNSLPTEVSGNTLSHHRRLKLAGKMVRNKYSLSLKVLLQKIYRLQRREG